MYDDKLQTIDKNNYIPKQKSIQENFNNAIKIVDDVLFKFYLQFKYLFLFVSILSKKVKTLNF